jgi:hypothetical protein
MVRRSEEAYKRVQRESGIPLNHQEVMHEIREIRRILEELERVINKSSEAEKLSDSK